MLIDGNRKHKTEENYSKSRIGKPYGSPSIADFQPYKRNSLLW